MFLVCFCFFFSHCCIFYFFFFSSRRRHTRFDCDWSSDVCSSDLGPRHGLQTAAGRRVSFPSSELRQVLQRSGECRVELECALERCGRSLASVAQAEHAPPMEVLITEPVPCVCPVGDRGDGALAGGETL